MSKVADARHCRLFAQSDSAMPSAGDHRPVIGDTESRADAGIMIDESRLAGAHGNFFHNLSHEIRNRDRELPAEFDRGLLFHDFDSRIARGGIMSVNDRTDA